MLSGPSSSPGAGNRDGKKLAEVVTENTIIARSAQVTDSFGKPVVPEGDQNYSDGLPALLRFTMPANSTSFTITLSNGAKVEQDITGYED